VSEYHTGTYSVIATSVVDPTQNATFELTNSPIVLSLYTPKTTVHAGEPFNIMATVNLGGVTWPSQVVNDQGYVYNVHTIASTDGDTKGVLIVPTGSGVCTLKIVSKLDSSKEATLDMTVVPIEIILNATKINPQVNESIVITAVTNYGEVIWPTGDSNGAMVFNDGDMSATFTPLVAAEFTIGVVSAISPVAYAEIIITST
jgi:hypothetical protein